MADALAPLPASRPMPPHKPLTLPCTVAVSHRLDRLLDVVAEMLFDSLFMFMVMVLNSRQSAYTGPLPRYL